MHCLCLCLILLMSLNVLVLLLVIFFFFFKQKTAYEMRISDWSSDVCSSDLIMPPAAASSDVARMTGNAGTTSRFAGTATSDTRPKFSASSGPVGDRRSVV